jgi:hypothetical protein
MYSTCGNAIGAFLDGTHRWNDEFEQIVPLLMEVASSTKAIKRFCLGKEDSAQRVSMAHGKSIPFSAKVMEHSSIRRGRVNW